MIGPLIESQRFGRLPAVLVSSLLFLTCLLLVWRIAGHFPSAVMDSKTRHRQVAGCVPIRESTPPPSSGANNRPGHQVLLISSRRNPGQLVFPKGGVKQGELPQDAALRETWEEAGIRGIIVTNLAIPDEIHNGVVKSAVMGDHKLPRGDWFVMRVTEVAEEWPEKDQRTRKWCSIEDALDCKAVKGRTRDLISKLADFLKDQGTGSSQSSKGPIKMKDDRTPSDSCSKCTLS